MKFCCFTLTVALVASAAAVTTPLPARSAAPAAEKAGYHLVRSLPLPGVEGWDYLTLDSAARRLYLARSTRITVLDVDTGKTVGEIANLTGVHGVAIDPKGGHGFITCAGTSSVVVFRLDTLARIADVKVDAGPDAILYEPTTNRVFSLNGRANSATVIDAATNKVVGTIALPGRPEFAVADGKGHVYNNIEDKGEIVEIDAKTLKVLHEWPLGAESPSGLAIDTKNRRLFSVCDGKKMVVTDADTGKVVATPTIGDGPDAAAFDAGNHRAFSSNGQDGTITVLEQTSPNTYAVLATVPTQTGARTMTIDPKTHHLWTVSAKTAPAEAPTASGRRRYVPGTFVVLEYAP